MIYEMKISDAGVLNSYFFRKQFHLKDYDWDKKEAIDAMLAFIENADSYLLITEVEGKTAVTLHHDLSDAIEDWVLGNVIIPVKNGVRVFIYD